MGQIKIDSYSEDKSFKVTSKALRVTDPCYDIDTWCSGQLDNVKDGEWLTRVSYHKDPDDTEGNEKYFEAQRQEFKLQLEFLRKNYDNPNLEDAYISYRLKEIDQEEENCKNYHGRESAIFIFHKNTYKEWNDSLTDLDQYILEDIDVGVDSGQAGFFDLEKFKKVKEKDPEKFYDEVYELTLGSRVKNFGHPGFGTLPYGSVSHTGYGDGSYRCYTQRNKDDELVSAVIVYINDYSDEDEDDAS